MTDEKNKRRERLFPTDSWAVDQSDGPGSWTDEQHFAALDADEECIVPDCPRCAETIRKGVSRDRTT